jgi:hypothetical protein
MTVEDQHPKHPIGPDAIRKPCPVCGETIVVADTKHITGSHLNADGTYHFKTCRIRSKKT